MGIQFYSNLAVGWVVNYEKVIEFLKENNINCCSKDFVCPSSCKCWPKNKLPEGIYLLVTASYYDCPPEDYEYTISLVNNNYKWNQLKELITDKLIEKGKKISIELGSEDEEPWVYSIVNIN